MSIAMLKIEFNWTRCPLKLSPNHLPSQTQCSCHLARWRKAWPYETEMLTGLHIRWYITCICNGHVDHINPYFSMQSTKTIANFPKAVLRNVAKFVVRECPRESKMKLKAESQLSLQTHSMSSKERTAWDSRDHFYRTSKNVWVEYHCRWAIIVESTVF